MCSSGLVVAPPSRIGEHLVIYYDGRENKLYLGTKCVTDLPPAGCEFLPLVRVYRATVIRDESKCSDTPSLGHLIEIFSPSSFEISCGLLICFAH